MQEGWRPLESIQPWVLPARLQGRDPAARVRFFGLGDFLGCPRTGARRVDPSKSSQVWNLWQSRLPVRERSPLLSCAEHNSSNCPAPRARLALSARDTKPLAAQLLQQLSDIPCGFSSRVSIPAPSGVPGLAPRTPDTHIHTTWTCAIGSSHLTACDHLGSWCWRRRRVLPRARSWDEGGAL